MLSLFSLLEDRFVLEFLVRTKMAENTSFCFQVIDKFNLNNRRDSSNFYQPDAGYSLYIVRNESLTGIF